MDPSTKEGEKRDVQNLRDDVGGTSKVRLGYMLPFGIMQKKQILCTKYLALHEIKRLIDAVQRKFRIIAYYDDLPLAIPIGSFKFFFQKIFFSEFLKKKQEWNKEKV